MKHTLKRLLTLGLLSASLAFTPRATAATLNAGDIVVIGHNSATVPETVTFMPLVDLPAGTVVKMTDHGWTDATATPANSFGTSTISEVRLTWTPASAVPAGTLLQISKPTQTSVNLLNITTGASLTVASTATTGELFYTGWTGATINNNPADGIFFYQDGDTNPFFLSAFLNSSLPTNLNATTGWYNLATAAFNGSTLPVAGVGNQNGINIGTAPHNDGEAGTNGLSLFNFMGAAPGTYFDNVQYTGPTSATNRAGWLSRVMTATNWSGATGTTAPTNSIGTSAVISSNTTITSLNRVNTTPSNSGTVNWTLTFAAANTGVTASNFSLSGTATAGASVGTPTTANSGLTWNVPVTTGNAVGTLTLNLANATGTTPGVSTALPFAGETYNMDKRATVTTNAASSITPTGATLNASVNANGLSTAVTFEYGLTTGYGNSITATPSPATGSSATAVTALLSGLAPGQTYNFRAVGVNAGGTTNGLNQSFTVGTGVVIDFETTGTGSVVTSGATSFTSSALTWTTTGTTTVQNIAGISSAPPGEATPGGNGFTDSGYGISRTVGTNIGGIKAPAGYVFRAASIDVWPSSNEGLSVYGGSNNTLGTIGLNYQVLGKRAGSTVVTANVTDTARTPPQSGALTGGYWHHLNLTGTAFATTDVDTIEFVIVAQTGVAMNYIALDNLTYSSLSAGSTAPTVTTATQSTVTATSATLGGNVTADGGASVTERGIVWGTATAPTTANNKVQNGSGTGIFSGTVTGLPAGTTIFVRAYAINSVNTSYGNEISFATPLPTASISVSPASVSEDGATNLTYTVTLNSAVPTATTVNITTAGTATSGTDYTGAVSTLTIPANTTTGTITIDPGVDGSVEADETVILTVAAGTGYSVGVPASATGAILNDDVPSATIAVSPANVAEDGATNLIYTVTLNQASFSALSVAYTVSGTATNGTDYATVISPLVIPAGNTTGTITVNPTADATIEANETVILTLSAGAGYTVGVPSSATGNILNDDLPNLTINDVTLSEGNSSTTNFTFTVSLSAPAGPGGVTFDIATANGSATTANSDYAANSLTGQTIPAGNNSYTFTVQVTGDTANEPSETFFANVTNVVNAVVVDGQGVGTIANDDPLPSLSVANVTSFPEGNSGTTNMTFTVTLATASGQTVQVNYATSDGTATTAGNDYSSTSGTLTFTPGQLSQTFNVAITGDTVVETNESFTVTLSSASNATIGTSTATGTITNDDAAVANNYVVTTIVDSDPAGWTALELSTGKINGSNTVSLRSAVLAANQSGVGPHTISVPAGLGTYVLSQTNPTNAATFSTNGGIDLVVGSNGSAITIQGTGGKAIIQRGTGSGLGDVITTGLKADGFTPAIVNLTLDSLDITGGTFTAVFTGADDGLGNVSRTTITNSTLRNNTNSDASFGQGGAVQNTNGYLTLNNTIFTSNTATNSGAGQGGAVYYSLPNASGQGSVGALSIIGCTFTSNTSGLSAGVGGGAIYAQILSAGTNTTINGCTFTSNSTTAGADGGAIVLDGTRAADITNNDFVTNSVAGTGSGGALFVNNGAVNLNYNRFAGNTAATAANGGTLRRSASATGTVNANDNWWQSNAGPATNAVVGTVTQTSRINLKLVASPTALFSNATSTLTADFFTTSSATTLTLPQVSTLIGRTVSFGSAVLGGLSSSQTTVQTAGTATSTYTAGLVSGTGSASVTVDGQTVSANIAVTGAPTVTSSTSALSATATSVIITGSNFSSTPASNSVAFTGAFVGSGTVTAATTTQLTVSLSGQISGALNAVVTVGPNNSGSPVQVATVIPVVTSATANLAANATSLTINGFGFSSTALNNSVAFNNGATGTVTAATSTSLSVSSLSGLVGGSLTAVVTSNSAGSGAAVQVATVTPVVTSSTAILFSNATTLTINGFGFSTTPGNNSVAFNNGTGTVTASTNTALTVTSLAGLVNGTLNAVVTTSSQNSGSAVQVATVAPPAGFTITPTSGLVTTEAGGTATFTVVLISQPSADVTVGLSSSNTAEGSVSPSSLTFTSVNWNVAQTVTVTGQNDLIVDGSVAYSIVTAAATSADTNYNTFNPADISVSNTDNDSNTLVIDSPSITEGNTGTSTLTFTVTSPTVVTGGFTVAYSTAAGTATVATDYLAASGTLTFAGTANETQTIAVTVNGDTLVEASETLTATLGAISAVTAPVLASQITSGAFGTGTITDNDAATVTIAKINDGAETPTSALFRVTQTAAASVDTVLTYSTGGTASSTDFTAPTGSVTITAGNTTADITVAITNDALVEATETLSLTLIGFTARDTDVTLGTTVLATADITDNDSATVSIAKVNDGAETNTPVAGLFRVTQTAASSTDTTLSYSVTGSAISGTDFTALSGSITIAAGQTTADISVAILNDNIVEASETITVTLTAFTARDTDITLSALPSATVAIVDVTDNDMATVSIAKINDGVEAAVPTNALFRVTQSSASSTNTVIAYNVTGTATSGDDFTALSGSVTITAGQTTADISVPVLNENTVEATETVILTMSSITSGDTDITLLAPLSATADITDSDTATVTLAKINDGAEPTTSALFRVTQTAAASVDTVLTYSTGGTASSTDFTAPTGSVTITAGNTTADITVAITNDALVEATETLSLTVTGFTARDADVSLGATLTATADITDNDTATVTIAKINDGSEPSTNGLFRVTQTAQSSTDTVITYAVTGTAGSTDFTALSGSITITAGQTTADISVPVIDENLVEATETVIATLNGFSSGDADVSLGATVAATVDIADNDSATVTLAKITNGVEAASPTNALFRVTQTNAASVDSVISYTVGGTATSGTDFTALSGSVTILAGNTTADIDVAVLNENAVEATETVSLTLTGFTARDPEVTLGTTVTDSADITDSDTSVITLAKVAAEKDEGTGGTTTAFTFSATLSNPVQGGFTLAYTTNDGSALAGSDYTDNDSSLSFSGAAESQTITVLVTHDGTNEIDETFTVALGAITGTTLGGALSIAESPQTGTILNDDALTITIAATDADADENTAATGSYRITRNGVLGATTVQLAVDASSSAVAADWTQSGATFASLAPSSTGTAVIPDGSTFVDITLTPTADLHAEAAETIRLNVTADAAYVVGSPADATVTIGQNDFLVINTNDAGEGTLRQAVLNANAIAGDDTITFDATAFATAQTITLTSGEIVISSNASVQGTGLITLNGNAASRIFHISGATAILSDLTLTNGSHATSWGGALDVVNASFVTLERCTVSNSTSALQGGGIYVNNGTLNVVSSTISGNTATTVGGGAIATGTSVANATVNVTNSTISGNMGTNGGAMLFGSNAVVNLLHTTVTNNTSAQGPNVWNGGGAITVANSIIAANQANTGHDDVGGAFTSSGGNLIGLGGGATGFTHGTNNDQFGTGAPINPLLGPLQDNGGPTLTHMLLNGSPAINAGLVANLPVDTFDQRGDPNLRQRGPAPDAGAIEAFAFEPTLTTATTDEDVQSTSGLVISKNTADGDLTTHYQITGFIGGFLYKNNGTSLIATGEYITVAEGAAGLKFTPNPNAHNGNTASFGFTAQAAVGTQTADLRGETVPVEITVNPVADAPSVTGTFTVTSTQSTDGLVITRNAVDSTEVTHFKITGIQNGVLYKNDGTTTIATNSFITVAEGSAGLKFTPAGGFVGSTSFTVQGAVDNTGTGLSPTVPAEINVGYPAPRITVLGPLVLNRKTGLYEHTVRITNAYVVPMDGFRLTNTNLLPEVQMWNRTHAYLPVIEDSIDLGAFSSRDVLVQYYSRERDIIEWEPTYSTDNLTDPEISVLPPDLSGLWHGLASRSTQPIFSPNPAVGARLEVKVNTSSVLSGKVTEGKTVKPFTARISGYVNLGETFGGLLESLVNQSNLNVPIPGDDVASLLAPYALTVIKGKTPAQDVNLAVIFIPEVNLMIGIMGGPEVLEAIDGLLGGLDGGNTRQGNIAELDDAGDEVETLLNLPFSIFLGWRNIWGMPIEGDRRAGPASPVATYQPTPYLARHHFAMAPIEVPNLGGISTLNNVQALSTPEGFSFGTLVPLNVAKKRGDYTVAGRLADGTSFTCSSFYGQYGQCLVHRSLYGHRGSLLGLLLIIPGEEIADNDVLGILTWLKPSPLGTAKPGRNYGRGFSLFMEAQGGTYTRPARGQIVMGLQQAPRGVANARMIFEGAGLSSSVNQSMRAASSGLSSLANTLAPTLPNPSAVNITSFSAATGLIKGSFTAVPRRTASFRALIVPTANNELPDLEENGDLQAPVREQTGYGYFLLPQVPVAPQTTTTAPILSGRVYLTPNVD